MYEDILIHLEGILAGTTIYDELVNGLKWGEGVKTRYGGHTRKAVSYKIGSDQMVDILLTEILDKTREYILAISASTMTTLTLGGVYINFYETGADYCPEHSHANGVQAVASFGTERKFKYGSTSLMVKDGDIVIFGSGKHTVPKCSNPQGRIGFALLFYPI